MIHSVPVCMSQIESPKPFCDSLLQYAFGNYEVLRLERLEKAFARLWDGCFDRPQMVDFFAFSPCPSQSVDLAVTWLRTYTDSSARWIADYVDTEEDVDEALDALASEDDEYQFYFAGVTDDREQFVIVGTRDVENLCETLENLNLDHFLVCADVLES